MKHLSEYLIKENFFGNLGIGKKNVIEDWLDKYRIKHYIINDDLIIDVKGDVDLYEYKEKQLPEYIKFGKVTGTFNIMNSHSLEILKGCPLEVGGDFYCTRCINLKSLEGCPLKVGFDFSCGDCTKMTSLKGCPKEVGYKFYCYNCGKQFTEDDVKKYCNIKGKIIV